MAEKKKYFPKILIVSHNALSKTQNNGKTIETLFKEWPKEKIFHLFFGRENDDSEFCIRSFCVTDFDALDNFFRLKKKRYACELKIEDNFIQPNKDYYRITQRLINPRCQDQGSNVGKIVENLNQKVIQRKPFFSWLRQSLWNDKKWFMNDILLWVKDIKPDLIFFQGSGFHYSYDIVEQILNNTNLPILLQLTDDYTQPPYKYSLIDRYITNRYLKIFQRVLIRACGIVVISEKMKEEYSNKFGGQNYFVMSNALDRNFKSKEIDLNSQINILYAGNLGLGRYKELIKFEQILLTLLRKKEYKIVLNVCSATILPEEIVNHFTNSKIIRWKGFLDSKEIDELTEDSDFLLHVESTDEINKRITRLSVSTKIGEYLGSERCIIAFGPQDIASIEYIQNKNLGLVLPVNSIENSICLLEQIIENTDFRRQFIENAKLEFNNRYNQRYISNSIYKIVSQATRQT